MGSDYRLEELQRRLQDASPELTTAILEDAEPADAAAVLQEMPPEEILATFEALDLESRAEILPELNEELTEHVLSSLEPGAIADLAEQMSPDDSADLIGEMEPEQQDLVLAAMDAEDRRDVKRLLDYPEGSAGALMTTEVLALPATSTMREVREAVAATEFTDPVFYVFVTEPATGRMLGQVTLQALFSAPLTSQLANLVDKEFVSVDPSEDQQAVARLFRKYDLWVMPVVDRDGRLCGRITADDILDVIQEEADEDLALMTGAPDLDEDETAPMKIAAARLPWLLITMVAGLINSVIIKKMLDVTHVVAVAIFIPAILAMGGNTGIQSSTICVRGLALGQRQVRRIWSLVRREMLAGLAMGAVCGTLTGLIVWGFLGLTQADTGHLAGGMLALTVGGSMANAMVFASCFGAVAPVLLHRLKIDPAHAAGPFITTFNDLSASLIYFISCLLVLKSV